MEKILPVINFITANGGAIMDAVLGVLSAMIVVALIIPGPQPEKALQGIVDFIKKFSKK